MLADPRGALAALTHVVTTADDLDDADVARVESAAVLELTLIHAEKQWAETAHVHAVPHRSLITTAPAYKGQPKEEWPEDVDASGLTCHDCGMGLVSDAGSFRLLVCPRLHARRPAHLVPGDDEAVECGNPA